MGTSFSNSADRHWHSNDFLIRLHRGEEADGSGADAASAPEHRETAPLAGDSAVRERLSVARSTKLPTGQVRTFGTRNRSVWALDVLAERYTGGQHDWASLRAAALRFAAVPRSFDPLLDRLKLKDLWRISEVLHERDLDREAERALLLFIAIRVRGADDADDIIRELFFERLIYAGLAEHARELLPVLTGETWRQLAIAAALEHARFGGSDDAVLASLNIGFHRLGLERVHLDAPGESAFQRLSATPYGAVTDGPLVTVIMTTTRPGAGALAAARSIVAQTYRNWELIVADDASPDQHASVLDELAALDPRVRVLRSETDEGPYVRRNEALREARGEYVTFQRAGGWSHPRRIQIQVQDLLGSAGKLANLVHEAKLGDDLSTVGSTGARLLLAESSLLFAREPVLELIGYFDTVRKGAATEFRRRLEVVTGATIGSVSDEIPLQFALAGAESGSESDFETGKWVDAEWLSYQASFAQFHDRIVHGQQSPRLPFPQRDRVVSAPRSWLTSALETVHADVLVVVGGQWSGERAEFLSAVADEIHVAVTAGLRVALLHSESVSAATRRPGALSSALQGLIDAGLIVRAFDADQVEAAVVVVRHAGAVQGHLARRRPVNADRVVVVEDAEGGDLRGETFVKADVDRTVRTWFDTDPEWLVAKPLPQRAKLHSVIVEGEDVRLTLEASDPRHISAVRLSNGAGFFDLPVSVDDEGTVVATGALRSLPDGELLVGVVRTDVDGATVQGCRCGRKGVVTTHSQRLLIPSGDRRLRVLPAESAGDAIGSREFVERYLSARVSLARIFRDHLELTVKKGPEVALTAVYGLREVHGRIRRRDFALDENDGRLRGIRSLDDLLDTRWKIFGTFETPLGAVESPILVTAETPLQDSTQYRIRKLSSGGVGVLHVVPQASVAAPDHIPTLSVVMPVYNVAPFLDTAIQSVLTQDFEDFELIIVDDASSDNGRQVIDMHRALDPRIRVIGLDHNTLGGAGVPSNLGIRAARGKYIAFVDSDDWVTKTAFAKMVQLADTHDAELVVGDFRTFDENDRTVADAYDSGRWRDIPLEQVISASSHPGLLRLSPVPWRKLYRRDFVQAHHVLYPEGDYFYEDNPLHWHVLSRAERIVACDEVVSYHRMAREGQTMGAYEYKLGAIASHANTILNSLVGSTAEHREVLFEQFVDYVSRQRWIVRRQTQPAAAQIIQRRLADIYDRAVAAEPNALIPQETIAHFAGYRTAYPELDLTVVIPVYNSADLLRETLDSVLQLDRLRYDVLLIDDGSEDDSLEIMREYEKAHKNVHVFEQKNRGAGRARNAVIPLATGRYTYFLDADDVIDARALREAVYKADAENSDLLFVQYRIEFTDENRSRGMFNADVAIWEQLPEATDNIERQFLLAGLVNYPWNRIIRTSLLQDANIFFGPTVVHNDVLYHWHSILSATNIGYLEAAVCTHRKFADRAQVTNISDERRMAVLEALRGTHERISDLDSYLFVGEQWRVFALDLLEWAKDRIPAELQAVYQERSERLAQAIDG